MGSERWVQIIRDQYNNYPSFENFVCRNFENNPPYQCTEYKTISFLSIISQSFAITTAVTAGLFSSVSFILDLWKERINHHPLPADDSVPPEQFASSKELEL